MTSVSSRLLVGAALLLAAGCDQEPPPIEAKGPVTRIWTPGTPVGNRLALPSQGEGRSARPGTSRPFNTGPRVRAGDYPWQIGLLFKAGSITWPCGGILVSPRYVLTAAHCLDAADDRNYDAIDPVPAAMIEISSGGNRFGTGTRHAIDLAWQPIIHPLYKRDRLKRFAYDVALVRLAQPVAGATPAPLQTASISSGRAVVSGWGAFDTTNRLSVELRAVAVPLIDSPTCTGRLPPEKRHLVTETTLCAESRTDDACGGDSGGPLVIGSRRRPQTIGVVSWGPSANCAVPGPAGTLIGGYTRGSAIAAWVRSMTGDPGVITADPAEPLFTVVPIQNGGELQ